MPRKREKPIKAIRMTATHREFRRGEMLRIPDDISEGRAEDMVKHSYARWVEVAVSKQRVERATAAHTR